MYNPLPTISGSVGNFFENLVPASHQTYIASPKPNPITPGTPQFSVSIPPVYKGAVYSPRPVPQSWQPAIASAYQAYPSLPRGILESVLMKESSMGTDDSGYNKNIGESAWLAGLTRGAATDLKNIGVTPDFNSQQGAIHGMAAYLAKRQSGTDLNGKPFTINDPSQLYFQRYKTNVTPTSSQDVKNFKNYMDYYNGQIASNGRTLN